jgi:hypothetical protein
VPASESFRLNMGCHWGARLRAESSKGDHYSGETRLGSTVLAASDGSQNIRLSSPVLSPVTGDAEPRMQFLMSDLFDAHIWPLYCEGISAQLASNSSGSCSHNCHEV